MQGVRSGPSTLPGGGVRGVTQLGDEISRKRNRIHWEGVTQELGDEIRTEYIGKEYLGTCKPSILPGGEVRGVIGPLLGEGPFGVSRNELQAVV